MAQKLNYFETETELEEYFTNLFQEAKNENVVKIRNLYEVVICKANILLALRKIKGNKGSTTAGVDGLNINDILQMEEEKAISLIRGTIDNYKPNMVRRVWIPKAGKNEKRPLGIPTIIDRIIQQMVKQVIEPICEAQFFEHSYGFRPARDAHQAMSRASYLINHVQLTWVVEGDIKGFFDNVNHNIMLNKCFKIGIHDKRVLMIIKAMLKAGIMGEKVTNDIGTPQGGIISPLLANIYLHDFDRWLDNQWRGLKTRHKYSRPDKKTESLKKLTNLKQGYLIRYADDWVLFTNSKKNAIRWKRVISDYLRKNLKLELSHEKTKVTDIKKKAMDFLGFNLKAKKLGSKSSRVKTIKQIAICKPNEKKIHAKRKELLRQLKAIKQSSNQKNLIHNINLYNSKVRGIINYFSHATHIQTILRVIGHKLWYAEYHALKRHGGKPTPVNDCDNVSQWFPNRSGSNVIAVEIDEIKWGLWKLEFATFDVSKTRGKTQAENVYTFEGKQLIAKRIDSKPLLTRLDNVTSLELSEKIAHKLTGKLYNFEYWLNRASAFNRDKGKCKITGIILDKKNLHVHHINPKLPLDEINKVKNLACITKDIHKLIHSPKPLTEISGLTKTEIRKLEQYREKVSGTSLAV